MLTKGEERKKINEERLKLVEEKSKKDESIQDLLIESLKDVREARKQEAERSEKMLHLFERLVEAQEKILK